jgi:hypothetical protein
LFKDDDTPDTRGGGDGGQTHQRHTHWHRQSDEISLQDMNVSGHRHPPPPYPEDGVVPSSEASTVHSHQGSPVPTDESGSTTSDSPEPPTYGSWLGTGGTTSHDTPTASSAADGQAGTGASNQSPAQPVRLRPLPRVIPREPPPFGMRYAQRMLWNSM